MVSWRLISFLMLIVMVIGSYSPSVRAQAVYHLWSQRFGDWQYQSGYSVAADLSGNVIVTGDFAGTVDFGGEPLTSAGAFDIFVAKFDAGGNHVWSQRFGDSDDQTSSSVAADASENVIVTGAFRGTVDFGGGPLASAGDYDIFVAKFDAGGNHVWSQRFGDSSYQIGYIVAADLSGNVIVTGDFYGTVDFGGEPLTSAGLRDIFVAKFDAGGSHVWSQRFGDSSSQSGWSVAADASGNVIVTGAFAGTVDFGGGPLTSVYDFWDIFVAKFRAYVTSIDIPVLPLTLSQNIPNPFNPVTTIRYYLPKDARVTLEIYDIAGKRVVSLVNKEQQMGSCSVQWDGKDYRGNPVASGVYFYKLTVGKHTLTKKMVLLK